MLPPDGLAAGANAPSPMPPDHGANLPCERTYARRSGWFCVRGRDASPVSRGGADPYFLRASWPVTMVIAMQKRVRNAKYLCASIGAFMVSSSLLVSVGSSLALTRGA